MAAAPARAVAGCGAAVTPRLPHLRAPWPLRAAVTPQLPHLRAPWPLRAAVTPQLPHLRAPWPLRAAVMPQLPHLRAVAAARRRRGRQPRCAWPPGWCKHCSIKTARRNHAVQTHG
jgi:hypothetical protein